MVYRFREYLPALPICGHLKRGGTDSRGNRIEANSLCFTKAGLPWIGVMGEYHYCRGEKENWQHELQKIDTGSVRFPPINAVGEVCFFLPFNLRMGKMLLEYATAQPLCLVGDTTFFMEIEGIEPVYKFAERQPISVCAGLASAFAEDSIKVVTLTGKQALGACKIDGKLCLCETEDLIASGGNIAAASGNKTFSYYVWETDGFTLKKLGDNVTEDKPQAKLVCIPCEQPFSVPEEYWKYLNADHYRSIKWFKLSVDSPNGFAEIDETFDVG